MELNNSIFLFYDIFIYKLIYYEKSCKIERKRFNKTY